MDGLAQRWHIAPSVVLAEPVNLVMGIIGIIGEEAEEAPQSEDELMRGMLASQSRVLDG